MVVMIGPALLLALTASPAAGVDPSLGASPPAFRPVGGATARASVSVRILPGVRFGPGRAVEASGAERRSVRAKDRHEQLELLEFQ